MRAEYPPEEWLPLSGIQHFVFCRRQWALIHVERQWDDNPLTAEGRLMHRRVNDPYFVESRKGLIIARSVPVCSRSLGLTGICDLVEFRSADEGVRLPGREGTYLPAPVEYKRGRPKQDACDEAQLCAQAMCLEEMLELSIPVGYLYYGRTRRRVEIELDDDLRALVCKAAREMHTYYRRGYTPRVRPSRACRACSLAAICLPKLQHRRRWASRYIEEHMRDA